MTVMQKIKVKLMKRAGWAVFTRGHGKTLIAATLTGKRAVIFPDGSVHQ